MKRPRFAAALAAGLLLAVPAQAQIVSTLLFEDFESVVLGDSVNERADPSKPNLGTVAAGTAGFAPVPDVWSKTAPGWTVDNGFAGNSVIAADLAYNPAAFPTFPGTAPPVGTIVGNTGTRNVGSAADGVDEWEGWSFVKKSFWVQAAGDQNRSKFTKGVGTVAVVDPDEYDDLGAGLGGGYMNSAMKTAPIDITTAAPGIMLLNFDSSWRDEAFDDAHSGNPVLDPLSEELRSINNQTAVVYATYDNGLEIVVPGFGGGSSGIWNSDGGNLAAGRAPSPSAKLYDGSDPSGSTANENLTFVVPVVPGASTVSLGFAMLNAGNDWWWAVDNIKLTDSAMAAIYSEDFEGVALGNSVNEQVSTAFPGARVTVPAGAPNTQPFPNSWSNDAPAGWSVDNSGIPNGGELNDDIGVFEWEGWSFARKDFWNTVTGNGRGFTSATGVVAVADGDEWDDLGNPSNGDTTPMVTVLETPAVNIAGVPAGKLAIEFLSAWRPEEPQVVSLTVDYGSGEETILEWAWDGTPNAHPRNENELVYLALNNPAGAATATFRFKYSGVNDYFWALDNIRIGSTVAAVIPEASSLALALLGLAGCGLRRRS
jgi:hypothetical protein